MCYLMCARVLLRILLRVRKQGVCCGASKSFLIPFLSTIFLKYDYVLALAKNTGMWHFSRLGGWNNAKEKPISGSSLTGATHQA